jgi:hypothetical protein
MQVCSEPHDPDLEIESDTAERQGILSHRRFTGLDPPVAVICIADDTLALRS